MLAATSPYAQIFDLDGSPLDQGFLYFGPIDQDPVSVQVPVFWDRAGTYPAPQPIRTLNGYPARNGSPALVFIDTDYSMTAKSKAGVTVFYAARSSENAIALGVDLGKDNGSSRLGFIQAGVGAIPRTSESKMRDAVNVRDFGSKGVGAQTTADSEGFQAAIDALPARGGAVIVPAGRYYFTDEPVFPGRSIFWQIDPGCYFFGPGAVYGKFRARTQFGNLPSGPWTVDNILEPTKFPECYNSQTGEAIIDDPTVPRYYFTGNLTTGSNVITNVSSFTGISNGTPIYDDTLGTSGLPYGYDASQARVDSFDATAKTITLTLVYTGVPKVATSLRTDFTQWKSSIFRGIRMNSKSRDTAGWAANYVVEFIEGAEGVGYGLEIDVVMYGAGGKGVGRGFLASGHGDYDPDTAYETSRSGSSRWLYGMKLGKVHNGLMIDADNTAMYFPFQPNRGIIDGAMGVTEFDSIYAKAWLALRQMTNGSDEIVLARATDTDPLGTFIRMRNAAQNADMFRFETNGNIYVGALPTTPPAAAGYLWRDGSTTPPTVRVT